MSALDNLKNLDLYKAIKKYIGNFMIGGFVIGTFVFVADIINPTAAGIASGVPIGLIVLFLIKLENVNKYVTSHLLGFAFGFITYTVQFILYVFIGTGLISSSLLALLFWSMCVTILVYFNVADRVHVLFFPDDANK